MKKVTFNFDQLAEVIKEPRLLPIISDLCRNSGTTVVLALELAKSQLKQLSIMFKDLPPEHTFDPATGDVIERANGKKVQYNLVAKK